MGKRYGKVKNETTPGGSTIVRHKMPKEAAVPAPHMLTEREMAGIEKYVKKVFGEYDQVLHEIISPDLHLDLIAIPPGKNTETWITTMGMSAAAMDAPRGSPKYAELCIAVPPTWPTDPSGLSKSSRKYAWPMNWLRQLARMPLSYGTHLDNFHTIPAGERLAPGFSFTGFMIVPFALDYKENAPHLKLGKKAITWLQVIPLYEEEMQVKLELGVIALVDAMAQWQGDSAHFVEPDRPNYASLVERPKTKARSKK